MAKRYDESYVIEILAAAQKLPPMTRDEFARFTAADLQAGYAAEVAEASRRYFKGAHAMTMQDAIQAAQAADDAFSAAITAAGFKSRWDWDYRKPNSPEFLRVAYRAKVNADAAMHAAFEASRGRAALVETHDKYGGTTGALLPGWAR